MADSEDWDTPGESGVSPKDLRKQLKDAKNALKAAQESQAEVDRLRQELTITKAGLTSLTDRQVAALRATHDGEWTPEAVQKTAAELWPTQTTQKPVDPSLDAIRRLSDAAAGAEPEPSDQGTYEDQDRQLREALDKNDEKLFDSLLRQFGRQVTSQ